MHNLYKENLKIFSVLLWIMIYPVILYFFDK